MIYINPTKVIDRTSDKPFDDLQILGGEGDAYKRRVWFRGREPGGGL